MKQLITKTTLLSFAGILLAIGVTTMTGANHDLERYMEGLGEIIIGIVLITIREYYKTIPNNGDSKTNTATVKGDGHG